MLVLAPLAFAGALAASPRRRRTLLQMAFGGTLTLALAYFAVDRLQSVLIARTAPGSQALARVFIHALTSSFFRLSGWLMVGGCAVIAVSLMSDLFRRMGSAALRRRPAADS